MIKKIKIYPLLIFLSIILVIIIFFLAFRKVTGKIISNNSLEKCELELQTLINLQHFKEISLKSLECKKITNENLLKANKKEKTYYESKGYYFDFLFLKNSIESKNNTEKILKLKQAQKLLIKSISLLYSTGKNIDEYLKIHEELNQEINQYYDSSYSLESKYFFQIDPTNELISKQTNQLIKQNQDIEKIKWQIFDFIRNNIEYEKDINWITDWVQPPAITLLEKKGDCEDLSILLASMLMNAGIQNVQLCHVDTNKDGFFDHMFVAVDYIAWDATYNGKETVNKDVQNWKQRCVEINKALLNPKSIEIVECEKGFVLGEDNTCHIECGEEHYCQEGKCCNNSCYICSKNSSLNSNCECELI